MIHYHGTPIGAPAPQVVGILRRRHAMVSHATPAPLPLVAEVCQSFALDNGAFSAWKAGQPVTDWSAFAAWVREWRHHPGFDWAAIPDVIDGSERDNNDLVSWWASQGFTSVESVPVWHLHESLERLDRLSRTWSRVALGSSGQYAEVGSLDWWGRMAEAMHVVCDPHGRPRCRLHGMRMLDPTIFSHLPLASADSTNVGRNIGLDSRWDRGPYPPVSKETRAVVLMERIELHAAASCWNRETAGVQQNMELIG